MNPHVRQFVLEASGASALLEEQRLQSLWSGYGEIVRVTLRDAPHDSLVLKYIVLPEQGSHPRGWNTQRSHQRKMHSYQVETHWYQQWSRYCGDACRVAHCYAAHEQDQEQVLLLEDLDTAGFPVRHESLDRQGCERVLDWLAHFHARFMGADPHGLWDIGSYWHLATRPDEWEKMRAGPLKDAADSLDRLLNEAHYQTLIHGDAKLANFCFSADHRRVAAVDFQYVGRGCGMKDVAYFLGSCLDEAQCAQLEETLLDYYFTRLQQALREEGSTIEFGALEEEWRSLYPIAWTDFYRFLAGWMPTHHKIHRYTRQMAERALNLIQQTYC